MDTSATLQAVQTMEAFDDEPPPVLPWRLFAAETVTGRIIADVPFVGMPQWAYGVNIAGSLQVTVPIGPTDYTGNGAISKDDLRQLRDYWRMSWGLAWGTSILQFGPVVTSQFDDVQGPPTLRVGCVGIWGLFSQKRIIANPAWTGTNIAAAAADVTLNGKTLRQIAKQLVLLDMQRNGALPIIQPTDDPAGTNDRQYFGYDLAYVGERLTELTQVQNGPECEFRPQFTDGTQTAAQWVQRLGDTEADQNPGRIGNLSWPHVYDYGRALVTLDEDSDGSRQAFEVWVRGNGMERELPTGHAIDDTLVDDGDGTGWPMLQSVDSDHTSATDVATLNSWAQADVATYKTPVDTLTATVRIDGSDGQGRRTGSPTLAEVGAGDNLIMSCHGHRWRPDGATGQRVIQVSNGRDLTTATLTLQET